MFLPLVHHYIDTPLDLHRGSLFPDNMVENGANWNKALNGKSLQQEVHSNDIIGLCRLVYPPPLPTVSPDTDS